MIRSLKELRLHAYLALPVGPPSSETIRLPERAARAGKLKLLVLGDRETSSHALPTKGDVTIGRGDGADVLVNDRSISRRHAVLHVGDGVTLEDLGSANGSWVRDRKLSPKETVAIIPGDVIELGATLLILQREGGGDAVHSPLAVAPAEPAEGSTPMDRLLRLVDRVAQSTIPVLVLGETGAGKEVLATRLHERSPRAGKPFVKLNCASLTEALMESELFGHEKGAFTGATQTKEGLFEAADGGTVLLDEIGEMPAALQARLLRVLEDKEVRRVGAVKGRSVDIRILSSTNRDLEAEVERGTFRRDLFFRLNGFALHLPPLRERRAEIPALARYFIEQACARDGRAQRPELSAEALARLDGHDWKGNLRELKSTMERAVLLCTEGPIGAQHIDLGKGGESASAPLKPAATASLRDEVAGAEKRRIVEALEQCDGNQTRAAALLGISRRTLVSRLTEYGIPRPRSKK